MKKVIYLILIFCLFTAAHSIYAQGETLEENKNNESIKLKKLLSYKIGELTIDDFRKEWKITGDNNLGIVDIKNDRKIVTYYVGTINLPAEIQFISGGFIASLNEAEDAAKQGIKCSGLSLNVEMRTILASLQFNLSDKKLIDIQK